MTSSTPSSAPTASATWRASPVIITTRRPTTVERIDGFAGLGADLVLERQRADDLLTADEIEHRRPAGSPSLGAFADSGGLAEVALAGQRGAADRVRDAVDDGFDAAPRDCPEPRRSRD